MIKINEIIRALPNKRWRQVLTLIFWGNYSYRQVGQILGISRQTVKRDKDKAFAYIYGKLNGKCDSSPYIGR